MARRVTSLSKKRTKTQTGSTAEMAEPAGAEASRRGRKVKSTTSEPMDPSLIGVFLPEGEKPVESNPEVDTGLPVIARRGRKPKALPTEQLPASMAADNSVQSESRPPELTPNSDGEPVNVQKDSSASPSASPRKTRRRDMTHDESLPDAGLDSSAASQPMQQAAARWDAATGTATFDWPIIEQVAAADGPNQSMAKLLLAARAEGANSRWPF